MNATRPTPRVISPQSSTNESIEQLGDKLIMVELQIVRGYKRDYDKLTYNQYTIVGYRFYKWDSRDKPFYYARVREAFGNKIHTLRASYTLTSIFLKQIEGSWAF